jgi:hypothetical protein
MRAMSPREAGESTMKVEFNNAELEAIKDLADYYLRVGGLDMNLPADGFGLILVQSVWDNAEAALNPVVSVPGSDSEGIAAAG